MTEISNEEIIKAWSNTPTQLIEEFGDEGDFTRRQLLNPALFSLLGDAKDKVILDAGCGQGYLARMLAKRGARVTGVEPAEAWLNYALKKEQAEPLGIDYVQADLSSWLSIPDTFDYVVANMVFMDIPDWVSALKNCVKALKIGGGLIFSILHPCFEESGREWKKKEFVEVRDYFQERANQQDYGYFTHRTLSTYLNSVIQAGCSIQEVIEPQLDVEVAKRYDAERYWYVPGYMVICARKGV